MRLIITQQGAVSEVRGTPEELTSFYRATQPAMTVSSPGDVTIGSTRHGPAFTGVEACKLGICLNYTVPHLWRGDGECVGWQSVNWVRDALVAAHEKVQQPATPAHSPEKMTTLHEAREQDAMPLLHLFAVASMTDGINNVSEAQARRFHNKVEREHAQESRAHLNGDRFHSALCLRWLKYNKRKHTWAIAPEGRKVIEQVIASNREDFLREEMLREEALARA